eukprot:COSAG06_NODE_1881_length_8148_cov_4.613617_8_plen_632_part_00
MEVGAPVQAAVLAGKLEQLERADEAGGSTGLAENSGVAAPVPAAPQAGAQPQPAAEAAELPAGWQRMLLSAPDPKGRTFYFVNHTTKTTHWELPAPEQTPQPGGVAQAKLAKARLAARLSKSHTAKPPVWERIYGTNWDWSVDTTDRIFYVNAETGELSWNEPTDVTASRINGACDRRVCGMAGSSAAALTSPLAPAAASPANLLAALLDDNAAQAQQQPAAIETGADLRCPEQLELDTVPPPPKSQAPVRAPDVPARTLATARAWKELWLDLEPKGWLRVQHGEEQQEHYLLPVGEFCFPNVRLGSYVRTINAKDGTVRAVYRTQEEVQKHVSLAGCKACQGKRQEHTCGRRASSGHVVQKPKWLQDKDFILATDSESGTDGSTPPIPSTDSDNDVGADVNDRDEAAAALSVVTLGTVGRQWPVWPAQQEQEQEQQQQQQQQQEEEEEEQKQGQERARQNKLESRYQKRQRRRDELQQQKKQPAVQKEVEEESWDVLKKQQLQQQLLLLQLQLQKAEEEEQELQKEEEEQEGEKEQEGQTEQEQQQDEQSPSDSSALAPSDQSMDLQDVDNIGFEHEVLEFLDRSDEPTAAAQAPKGRRRGPKNRNTTPEERKQASSAYRHGIIHVLTTD